MATKPRRGGLGGPSAKKKKKCGSLGISKREIKGQRERNKGTEKNKKTETSDRERQREEEKGRETEKD